MWRRAAPTTHVAGAPRQLGGRMIFGWFFTAFEDSAIGSPSRDRGINGGPRLRGETVYAAKALDRRDAPQGMLQVWGAGWPLLPALHTDKQQPYCVPPVVATYLSRPAAQRLAGMSGRHRLASNTMPFSPNLRLAIFVSLPSLAITGNSVSCLKRLNRRFLRFIRKTTDLLHQQGGGRDD